MQDLSRPNLRIGDDQGLLQSQPIRVNGRPSKSQASQQDSFSLKRGMINFYII